MEMASLTSEEKKRLVARVPEIQERLLHNLTNFQQYPSKRILLVGDAYPGIWLEHNQDNFFLAQYAPEEAWASQDMFMRYQREDGQLPFMFPVDPALWTEKKYDPVRFSQIQCIWAATRCAFEIAKRTKRPAEDLKRIYQAGSAWVEWLDKYRNTSGTGLLEMFCAYDTGHDNSPRVTSDGIPNKCPGDEARNMPQIPVMPILSVDLSAMLYGDFCALEELAGILGETEAVAKWHTKATVLRRKIRELLYDAEDHFYYDRDKSGFRKYRTEHVTRLFLNHVLTQAEFDEVYDAYFTTPGKGFYPAYPFPSVAIDDEHFVKECPRNCWGANTQSLTTERALLWMDHYGRSSDLDALLSHWLKSFAEHPESTFQQELNPFTGAPIGDGVNYTPTVVVYLEAVKRLNL